MGVSSLHTSLLTMQNGNLTVQTHSRYRALHHHYIMINCNQQAGFAVDYSQDVSSFNITLSVFVVVMAILVGVVCGLRLNGFLRRTGDLCCTLSVGLSLSLSTPQSLPLPPGLCVYSCRVLRSHVVMSLPPPLLLLYCHSHSLQGMGMEVWEWEYDGMIF